MLRREGGARGARGMGAPPSELPTTGGERERERGGGERGGGGGGRGGTAERVADERNAAEGGFALHRVQDLAREAQAARRDAILRPARGVALGACALGAGAASCLVSGWDRERTCPRWSEQVAAARVQLCRCSGPRALGRPDPARAQMSPLALGSRNALKGCQIRATAGEPAYLLSAREAVGKNNQPNGPWWRRGATVAPRIAGNGEDARRELCAALQHLRFEKAGTVRGDCISGYVRHIPNTCVLSARWSEARVHDAREALKESAERGAPPTPRRERR